jgi:hypothetical protein
VTLSGFRCAGAHENSDKLVVPYINILVHLKSGLLRGVTSFERGKLVVFSYLSTTDIWPVKRGDLKKSFNNLENYTYLYFFFSENIAIQDPFYKKLKPWAYCSVEEQYDMALAKSHFFR